MRLASGDTFGADRRAAKPGTKDMPAGKDIKGGKNGRSRAD